MLKGEILPMHDAFKTILLWDSTTTGPAGSQQRPAYQQQYTSPPLAVQQIQKLQELQAQQQHTLQMRALGGQQIRPGDLQQGTVLSKTHHNPILF